MHVIMIGLIKTSLVGLVRGAVVAERSSELTIIAQIVHDRQSMYRGFETRSRQRSFFVNILTKFVRACVIEAIIYSSLTRILIVDLLRRLIYIRPGSTAIHSSEAGCLRWLDIDGTSASSSFVGISYMWIGRSYIGITIVYVICSLIICMLYVL